MNTGEKTFKNVTSATTPLMVKLDFLESFEILSRGQKKLDIHRIKTVTKSSFRRSSVDQFELIVLVGIYWGAMSCRGGRWTSLDASFARCFAMG